MAETVDELTINYEDGGIQTVKELDKKVLTKGAWATLMFRYQDWNNAKGEYGPINTLSAVIKNRMVNIGKNLSLIFPVKIKPRAL